jgi:hypothetical protein
MTALPGLAAARSARASAANHRESISACQNVRNSVTAYLLQFFSTQVVHHLAASRVLTQPPFALNL